MMIGPGWLYASGNLPRFYPGNEDMIMNLKKSCPAMAEATFENTARIFQKLREAGVPVPYTYNERMLRICQTQKWTTRICGNIIINEYRR